ncbi:MAG: trypsin-like serine protease [Proteobacteria bacterium]|nr:trypsin-like serine protease [Pseudomonadota bacterium]
MPTPMVRLYAAVLSAVTCACAPAANSELSSANAALSYDDVATQIMAPIPRRVVTAYHQVTIAQYYQTLLAATTDESFSVGGHELRGVHSRLVAAAEVFAELDRKYKSWGARAAANTNFSVAPGRYYSHKTFANLAGSYVKKSGAFNLTGSVPTSKPTQTASHVKPLALSPQPQHVHNLAALVALALAGQSKAGAGLALVTNGISGAGCAGVPGISAVSKITYSRKDNSYLCTGTFFKGDSQHDYMLTAAHCTTESASEWSTTNPQGANVRGVAVHKGEYASVAKNNSQFNTTTNSDLAIIAFPPGTAGGYVDVATTPVTAGAPVILAGYGNSSQVEGVADAGVLRCGQNSAEISTMEQGAIRLTGIGTTENPDYPAGTNSITGSGDSGGPIFDYSTGSPRVVGVVSNGSVLPADGTVGESHSTDVSSSSNQQFISNGSQPSTNDYPLCTNGSNNGDGFGYQPGIGGPNNGSCRAQ